MRLHHTGRSFRFNKSTSPRVRVTFSLFASPPFNLTAPLLQPSTLHACFLLKHLPHTSKLPTTTTSTTTTSTTSTAKMFVRNPNDIPQDPCVGAALPELGYEVNDKGQFVKVNPISTKPYMQFFISDSDRLNEVNKEAMHRAARECTMNELKALGMKEYYLCGEDGAEILGEKPGSPHVVILANDNLEALKKKTDVVVVVGEHNQDAGIWAYRSLMAEGGMKEGSAVGLVKKLKGISLHVEKQDPFGATASYAEHNDSFIEDVEATGTPGLIILNPGQLIYSPELNKSMTYITWKAREKAHALSPPFELHPVCNRVPGHGDANQHINTTFTHVIPELVKFGCNLYVVGITDGAERYIKWADQAYAVNGDDPNVNMVHAMAFMEPLHNPTQMQSAMMVMMMRKCAKSWIKSNKLKGTFINAPGAVIDFGEKSDGIKTGSIKAPPPSPATKDGGKDTDSIIDRASKTAEEVAEAFRTPKEFTESPIKANFKKPVRSIADSTLEEPAEAVAGDEAIVVTKSGNEVGTEEQSPVDEDKSYTHITNPAASNIYDDEDTASDHSNDSEHSLTRRTPDITGCDEDEGEDGTTGLIPIMNDTARIFLREESTTLPGGVENGSRAPSPDTSGMEESYDFSTKVSCATYSGGVAHIDELLWPNVVELVLDHFDHMAQMWANPGRATV